MVVKFKIGVGVVDVIGDVVIDYDVVVMMISLKSMFVLCMGQLIMVVVGFGCYVVNCEFGGVYSEIDVMLVIVNLCILWLLDDEDLICQVDV